MRMLCGLFAWLSRWGCVSEENVRSAFTVVSLTPPQREDFRTYSFGSLAHAVSVRMLCGLFARLSRWGCVSEEDVRSARMVVSLRVCQREDSRIYSSGSLAHAVSARKIKGLLAWIPRRKRIRRGIRR